MYGCRKCMRQKIVVPTEAQSLFTSPVMVTTSVMKYTKV